MCIARRFSLGLVVALALASTGCADSFPSKAEFITEAKRSIPSELSDQIADAKITPDAGNTLIEQHLGCIYDTIRNDEDLVQRYVDDPESKNTQGELDASATHCNDQLHQALLEAVTASTK